MFNLKKMLFLHAITSVHAGSGSELGLVDLPIQREKHTGYPKIESSSLKGAVRATVSAVVNSAVKSPEDKEMIEVVFGKEGDEKKNNAQAGAISLSDARLLLFPVRSLRGVFAWVTCPLVLKRYNQELKLYCPDQPLLPIPETKTAAGEAIIVNPRETQKQVVLEEYTYEVKVDDACRKLAEYLQEKVFPGLDNGIRERLLVLPDDDFTDFVTLSTEVNARIRIDPETGTVKDGALWYEENVPPESVFYSFCFIGQGRLTGQEKKAEEIWQYLKRDDIFPEVFQLGGNSTLGKGILRRIWR